MLTHVNIFGSIFNSRGHVWTTNRTSDITASNINEDINTERKSKKQQHRKDKPWDTDDIDHWKIEPFEVDKDTFKPFTEESSFATLFPKYREVYLREIWGHLTKVLDGHVSFFKLSYCKFS